ncbi:hypothetical protein ACLOJK_010740 [Asimina triloba]
MENHLKFQDKHSPISKTSPNSSSSSSSGSSSNGLPQTPKPIQRPETNAAAYPTTFVQADTSSFKQVVQMLTGSPETAAAKQPSKPAAIPPTKTGPKKPSFKLYERRNSHKTTLKINPLMPNSPTGFSPRHQAEILSPSMLNFPSLVLSPVTPLSPDPFNRPPPSPSPSTADFNASAAEERAIAEKGFYLHPSPRTTTPRDSEPRLLPLFPVTSPRVSSGSS